MHGLRSQHARVDDSRRLLSALSRCRLDPWDDTPSHSRGLRYSVFHIRVSSSGLERILPHQLDDAGNRIIRPATGYAIEPAAQISRRPHASDAVAGPGVRRVARMVQEPSLQAAGPRRAARHAGQAGVGWRSIGRSPTAIRLKNTGGGHRRGRPCLVGRAMTVTDHAAALFFRAVARDRHPTPACTASRTLRAYEKCFSP